MVPPQLSIPPSAWRRAVDDGRRLLTTIVVDGCSMHLEAVAVDRRDGVQSWHDASELDAVRAHVGADREWETVEIEGREYVLLASPYCA